MEVVSMYGRNITEEKKFKWKCNRCSSIFIAFKDEMDWSVMGQGMCGYTVRCPVCHHRCDDILDSCEEI